MTNVVIWCFAFGIYLLLAGTISANELITAGVLASLATAWAYLIRQSGCLQFTADREQILPVLGAVAGLLPATVRTGARLLSVSWRGGSPGRSERWRFHFGSADDPRARTRRALAVFCASLAPNRFVVHVDPTRNEALMHGIDGAPSERDTAWLR
jgi:hypothetical protein